MAKLLFPEEARQLVARRFERHHRTWLLGGGTWPLAVNLGVPTERETSVDASRVRAWVDAWAGWNGAGEVERQPRRWAALGEQRLPTVLRFASPAEVASVAGQEKRWRQAARRYGQLVERFPVLAARASIARHFDVLADYPAVEIERLVALLTWVQQHPASNAYLRQLPVEGLDTKWTQSRKGIVADFVRVLHGESSEGDFYSLCGLRRLPHRLRLRILCPEQRRITGGIGDLESPLGEIAALPLSPAVVIIVENLETGLALPDIPRAVTLMKLGHSIGVIRELPWLRSARVIYWGDIDTHGYVMLDRARAVVPNLESLLMGESTFLAHRSLWGREPEQHAVVELPRLSGEERCVYTGLRAGTWGEQLRLEQERIPWDFAMRALTASLLSPTADR